MSGTTSDVKMVKHGDYNNRNEEKSMEKMDLVMRNSETLASLLMESKGKFEESENGFMKSRSVLIDITNDSPIVGLAIGNYKTPSSTVSKKRLVLRNSESIYEPGLGEALLRDQVKTLLQKVEEEALVSKISFEPRNFVMNSPMCFCPPTPANTPQLLENNEDSSECLNVSPVVVVVAESFSFCQILDQQEEIEEIAEKHLIAELFTPLPEEIEGYESSLDDKDDASVWSMQVNASTCDELEDFEEFGAIYDDGDVDEFCDIMSEICVNDDGAEFSGKDERYVNDVDCEIKGDS